MQLVIDLGNTNAKLFLFYNGELVEYKVEKELEPHELAEFIAKNKKIKKAIISSVVNHDIGLEEEIKKLSFSLVLNDKTKIPVQNLYTTPETLGRDRLAAAIGANELYPNQPVLAIDAGTCIKYDFVNEKNQYLGGAISPGINMRLSALNHFTDKLPLVEKQSLPIELIGNSTETSILSGAINGALSEINDTINRYKEMYPALKVVLSGGDCVYLEKGIKNSIFVEPFLVQKGLNRILTYNL
ncbi:MAG: type III pantothenate kinase [Bacteroidota bacterium]